MDKRQNLATIALISGAIAIGLSPILVRLSETDPIATAFYRVAFAVPVFWCLTASPNREIERPKDITAWLTLALAATFFAGDLAFWHLSLQYTYVANSTLLANTAPIFVTLASWLLFSERVSISFLIGLIVAMVGVVALLGQSAGLGSQTLLGDGLAILTAIFYSGYLLTISRLRNQFATTDIMMYSSAICALILAPVMFLVNEQILATSMMGWLTLLGLACISQAGGQGMVTYALRHVPTSFSSVTLLVQPVVAGLVAWFLFDEKLTVLQLAGVFAVLSGILLCRRATLK